MTRVRNDEKDLFRKCYNSPLLTQVEIARKIGFYPYFRALSSAQSTEVVVGGKRMIMLGSNNYLGLTDDPRVIEAAVNAVKKYGSGCAGSRFLNGNLELHKELEERIARFLNREAAVVFSTGFQTNLGIIQALVGRRDVIVTDKLDHASIIDGCRLSFGKMEKFEHNDMEDLKNVLMRCRNNNVEGILITVDGIFSMEGDITDLPNIVKLAEEYDARILVDDAHAIGVLGENGRGTGEHYNMEDRVDLVMGTFSKSLASLGGFVAGKYEVIEYIRHYARSLIFSAAIPPANAAAALKALEILESEPERRERLWKNTRKMKEGLDKLGFNTGNSTTPIIPIVIEEKKEVIDRIVNYSPEAKEFANIGLLPADVIGITFWRLLHENGLFVNIVLPPAVPPGRTLIRTSYTATHTDEQLDRALEIFARVGKMLGIIE
jgi:8-amino-7-oxononanoate synthase